MAHSTNEDHESRRASLKARAVRLRVSGVVARLGLDRVGHVVNISAGGALLRLNERATVGDRHELTLLRGAYLLRVPTSVVRVSRSVAAGETDKWDIAVRFDASTSTIRPQLTELLPDASGVRVMVRGMTDRRLPTRLPDPACPVCGAIQPSVQVERRPAAAVVFRCARCRHSWSVPKPPGT